MSLKSMTGYGRAAASIGGVELSLEVSSVNRRGLEIFVSGPPEWSAGLEGLIGGWAREFLSRGKISFLFQARTGGAANSLTWDTAAFEESFRKLERQAVALATLFNPNGETLLRLAELCRTKREDLPSLGEESTQTALRDVVRVAIGQLLEMRLREGAFLAKDMLARIDTLDELLRQVAELSHNTVPRYREQLIERLRQSGLELDLTDERVLKEIALFADRCDIEEEITRLRSHFQQFRECCAQPQEVGRKLDFLCQEMNREANTIGSKANNLEITRRVIEAKNELERIREQVQNVE